MEIFKQTNFDFLGKKWPFIAASLLLTLAGIVSLVVKGGPKYGIDFTGGALMDVKFQHRPPAEAIRAALHKTIPGEIEVQEISGTQEVFISTGLNGRSDQALQGVRAGMVASLNQAFNPAGDGKIDLEYHRLGDLGRPLARPAGPGWRGLDRMIRCKTLQRTSPHSVISSIRAC